MPRQTTEEALAQFHKEKAQLAADLAARRAARKRTERVHRASKRREVRRAKEQRHSQRAKALEAARAASARIREEIAPTSVGATFTKLLARKILERVRRGETLSMICREPDMPDLLEVYDWMGQKEPRSTARVNGRAFREAYEQACRDRAHSWRDKALELAMEVANGAETVNRRDLEGALELVKLAERDLPRQPRSETAEGGGITVVLKRFTPREPVVEPQDVEDTSVPRLLQ